MRSVYTPAVVKLLCSLVLITLSIAVLNTLVPLWLTHADLPVWQVGLVSSSYFCGNFVGTLLAGRLIKRWGFAHSYHISCILFALAAGLLALSLNFWLWLSWRFLAGVGCAFIWVIVESALLHAGTAKTRGKLLATYMVVYYIGTVAGQLILSEVPTGLMQVLPWVVIVTLLGMLPMLFTKIKHRVELKQNKNKTVISVWSMFRHHSAWPGISGTVISGFILGTLYGLMPLYLAHEGVDDARVADRMALLVSAGIVGQWPVGYLADRLGRMAVLRMQIALVAISSVAMLYATGLWADVTLFILGASAFTLYPVAMAWACEQVSSDELIAMNQTLLLSYTVGSLSGPTLTAIMMDRYSNTFIFIAVTIAAILYLSILIHYTLTQRTIENTNS